MDAAAYDAWYETARGRWIGDTEYRLLHRVLAPSPGDSLLDVGCGSGHFTRRFARDGLRVTGLDPDAGMLRFAAAQLCERALPDRLPWGKLPRRQRRRSHLSRSWLTLKSRRADLTRIVHR